MAEVRLYSYNYKYNFITIIEIFFLSRKKLFYNKCMS